MRAVAIIIVALAAIAHADPAPAASEADRLFQEGRALLKDGKHDEACAKFEQSILKDPRAVGTLMNLALCNERRGRTATALRYYQEAFDRATEANLPTQRQTAQEQIAALTAQVPVVVVTYSGPILDGQRLLVDDAVIAADRTELQVDPGTHAIVLTAPGRLPYETQLNVKPTDRKALKLPMLEVPKTGPTIIRRSATRRIGKIVTLGGAAFTLAGVAIAGVAKHRYDLQFSGTSPACGGPHGSTNGVPLCTEYGAERVNSARNLGTAATVVGGLGLAAIATGLTLWLSSPSDEVVPRVAVTATGTSAGLAIVGAF